MLTREHDGLPTAEQVELLWARLRALGFQLTAEQLAAAQYVRLSLAFDKDESRPLVCLEGMLSAIFAKSAYQKEMFSKIFWEVLPHTSVDAGSDQANGGKKTPAIVPVAPSASARLLKSAIYLLAAAFLCVPLLLLASEWWSGGPAGDYPLSLPEGRSAELRQSCLGGGRGLVGRLRCSRNILSRQAITAEPSESPPPDNLSAATITSFDLESTMVWAMALAPVAFAIAFLLGRLLRHRALYAVDQARIADRLETWEPRAHDAGIFSDPETRVAARRLRNQQATTTEILDLNRTVNATAEAAGIFSPVFASERGRAESIVLVEQEGMHDNLAQLYVHAARELGRNGVPLATYTFHSDPRVVTSASGETHYLKDIYTSSGLQRLVVIGTGNGLFRRITGRLDENVKTVLSRWTRRYLLSTKPVDTWGSQELQLVEAGFSVGTATRRGVSALAKATEARIENPSFLDVEVVGARRTISEAGIPDDILQRQLVSEPKTLKTLSSYQSVVWSIARSPSGQRMVAAGNSGLAYIWDLPNGAIIHTLSSGSRRQNVLAAAYSPLGDVVATSGEAGRVFLWDPTSGALKNELFGETGWTASVAFSSDGKILVAAGQHGLRVWDAQTGSPMRQGWSGIPGLLRSVTFSPDGRTAAFGGESGKVYVVSALDGQRVATLEHGDRIRRIAYSSDGKRLAAAGASGRITVWDAYQGRQIMRMTHGISLPLVRAVAFSPVGLWLATGGQDGVLRLWSSSSGRPLRTYEIPKAAAVCDFSISADGGDIAVGLSGGDVRIVSVRRPS